MTDSLHDVSAKLYRVSGKITDGNEQHPVNASCAYSGAINIFELFVYKHNDVPLYITLT